MVAECATRRRRADEATLKYKKRTPSAQTVARQMTSARADLSRAQTVLVAAIEGAAPPLVEARTAVDAFHVMVRKKQVTALDDWLERASQSLVAAFGRGLARDRTAVNAEISTAWSNAQAEGRSSNTNWSNARCTGAGNSTCSKRPSLDRDPDLQQNCVRAKLPRRYKP